MAKLCKRCEFREVTKPKTGRTPDYCDVCRNSDKSRNRGKKSRSHGEIIVCVDTEGSNDAFGIMRMETLSFAREDGTSGTFHGSPKDALLWLVENCTGIYQDKVQRLHSFHFTYDQAVLLKDFEPDKMELILKAGSRKNNLLCRSDVCDHKSCGKLPYRDPKVIADIMTSGAEGDVIAWDPETKLAVAAAPKRRFWVEYRPDGDRYTGRKLMDIHDHGTAFTGGLEKVIETWRPELEGNSRNIIAWGKRARKSGFRGVGKEWIAAYSEAECLADARVVRKLLEMIRKSTGIPMTAYRLFGSGSIAAQAYRHYGAPKGDECDQTHELIARATYFGGAIETPVVGLVDDTVESVDINSAYPDKMRHLPCMRKDHGVWHEKKPTSKQFPNTTVGHVLCEWELLGVETSLPPFAVRDIKGNVYRPLMSSLPTWVSLPEYKAGIERYGKRIKAKKWLWWEQTCNCPKPLAFVEELYDKRNQIKAEMKAEFKANGYSEKYWELDAQQMAVKLIINSMYGKLAQSRPTVGTYTNFHYASYITGATRAQLCRQAWEYEDKDGVVVYVHTDSVKGINAAMVDGGKDLGAWGKDDDVHGLGIFQPGLTVAMTDGEKSASRGCDPGLFRKISRKWIADNSETMKLHPFYWPVIQVKGQRMISRKAALHRGKPHLAGNFVDHTLNIGPSRNKRDMQNSYPLPGQNRAWIVPPKLIVENTAGPEHMFIVREAVEELITASTKDGEQLGGIWEGL